MAAANGIAENRIQMQNNETQCRQWVFDERDNFISWLRGEFAAANAIIDALCQHLRIVGDSAEYDHVLCSIQQRRCNWAALLHMQQYFSVAEVLNALQQVSWRKQQSNADHAQIKDRNVKLRAESAKKWREGAAGSSSALHPGEGIHNLRGFDKMSSSVKAKEQENSQCQVHSRSGSSGSNAGEKHQGPYNEIKKCDFRISSKQEDQRRSIITVSKNFIGNELVDGKMINIVEGLELYENIFDSSEISGLTSYVQELKLAGRKKQLRGQTFVVSKRPARGHGREMIQFGVPIMNAPLEGEVATGTLKDLVEPIPTVMEDVINRLFQWQLIRERRPDSCIINFFNEGDHSQPHICPSYFERPFCILTLLSECSMVFGRSIAMNHPGDYKGPLKVSLHAGSLMVLQGNSADLARYAICSSPLPRATITFVKVKPKKAATFSTKPMSISLSLPQSNSNSPQPVDQRSSTSALVTVPREGRGVNQTALKNFNMPSIHTSGVLPVPSIHASQVNPCLPAPRIQPLFAGPTGPVGGYPSMAVVPTAWMAVPRHPPRMATSGTGVFFPGSGSGSDPCQCVTLPQEQQVLGLSSGLPRSEPSSNGATSTEPSVASNQTKPASI
ncbi:hypothetical protein SUGI_0181570 [Cryptomeria japonica]|nr:hypothetical protein SUGI_0181570 [Cryptomeria japonica]